MNGQRDKPASRQYEQYRLAIERIEARLQPQLDAWAAEKIQRARVMVFGEEAVDDDWRKPPTGDTAELLKQEFLNHPSPTIP